MAVLPLSADLTATGFDQKALHELLTNLVTVVNELVDDHATNKKTIDECRTAIMELIDDHATFVTVVGDVKTAVNAVITAAGTSIGAVAAVTPVSSSAPATLTAGDPTASAATLTNSTDLTLLKG